MEEKSKFQMDVEVVSQALKRRAGKDNPQQEAEKLFEKFSETKQEPVKLAVALRGFFLETVISEEQKMAYETYLKGRVRPTIETLIEEEAVEKIAVLEEKGWFGNRELEGFIKTARSHQKTASLVWLLHLKNKKYGYQEKDFSL